MLDPSALAAHRATVEAALTAETRRGSPIC